MFLVHDMHDTSCPFCKYALPPNDNLPGTLVQCPACGESFAVPPIPLEPRSAAKEGGQGGGVFVLGALLLAAVVIAVVLFWGGLLKKREVRPKQDKKSSAPVLWQIVSSSKPHGKRADCLPF